MYRCPVTLPALPWWHRAQRTGARRLHARTARAKAKTEARRSSRLQPAPLAIERRPWHAPTLTTGAHALAGLGVSVRDDFGPVQVVENELNVLQVVPVQGWRIPDPQRVSTVERAAAKLDVLNARLIPQGLVV